MVMRNRDGGSEAPHWWDDLPPKVRERFSRAPVSIEEEPAAPDNAPPAVSRGELVSDLSGLAALFVLASLAILLYLLVAVAYVTG
jgi:hypothetical protein